MRFFAEIIVSFFILSVYFSLLDVFVPSMSYADGSSIVRIVSGGVLLVLLNSTVQEWTDRIYDLFKN